jgi:mannose-6-phosphate isomerase-like protein (cupin superfamily)
MDGADCICSIGKVNSLVKMGDVVIIPDGKAYKFLNVSETKKAFIHFQFEK